MSHRLQASIAPTTSHVSYTGLKEQRIVLCALCVSGVCFSRSLGVVLQGEVVAETSAHWL